MLSTEPDGMCGRNLLFTEQDDLEARFDAEVVAEAAIHPDTTLRQVRTYTSSQTRLPTRSTYTIGA
ncbi:hypothetical protein C489_13081 [Natrinema versiforme JCM 10478]|uniref:Uncharacterized protein n=1 Tax=Natrinema versiforme JCM 10478 TaxID=1227496 RepID=L9XXZ0_9EURY|nr:hypothetical protein C489_13081 [Natrinema versiforme JCM 10478]